MPVPETLYGPRSSILVTGASSGIGAALARHLAPHGGRLALVARRKDRLHEVADQVRAAGGQPLVVEADVTDPAAVRQAAETITAAQGPVDVAFLNAGVGDPISLSRFDGAKAAAMFQVNVLGVVYWLDVLLPPMLERRRGVIAGTSSLAAARAMPGGTVYSATKAAVSVLLEGYRAEAAARGLQITVVEPGFVKSEMTERNKFPMPFLMSAEKAAEIIADGVAEGQRAVRFPWPTAAAVDLLRLLPAGLYDRVMTSMAGKGPRAR